LFSIRKCVGKVESLKMPNLCTHFNFGLKTMAALQDPSIGAYLGSFLLGCTAPDVRAVTKWRRDHTHFATLEVDRIGVGTEGLFGHNPDLYQEVKRTGATRSFIAGYISHLTTDEAWITQIYRPYFGDREKFPNGIEANVWDRAVQLDMERESIDQMMNVDDIIEALQDADRGVGIGFIDAKILRNWNDWVADFIGRPFKWDRLYFLVKRMYREDEEAQLVANNFLSSLYPNLNKVYRKVPRSLIKDFESMAVCESTRLIREHLDGP